MLMTRTLSRMATMAAVALTASLTVCAHADNLVTNGSFESTATNASAQLGTNGQQVTGWTSQGYNFVFLTGTADTTGATGVYGNLQLWGPGNGSANGLGSSPAGGNYIGMDGAFDQGPLQQTISGLQPGVATTVSFWFAGAQQHGYTGMTTEQFAVSLGNQTIDTDVVTDASHGFTGWEYETMTFTPTSASQVLSFLAIGTPGGEPPFSLLDGVSVSQTPEPSALVLMGTGVVSMGGLLRRRFSRS